MWMASPPGNIMDDATRRRLRDDVQQSRQLQMILAHAALGPAFLYA